MKKLQLHLILLILKRFDTFSEFRIEIEPENANHGSGRFNMEIVKFSCRIVENGKIEGVETYKGAEVTVSSPDGNASTTIIVNVGSPLTGISASELP